MKWIVGVFGVLVAFMTVLYGADLATSSWMSFFQFGWHNTEFGNAISTIRLVLFVFILGASWALAAERTFLIISSEILLVIGVSRISAGVSGRPWETAWPGFIFIVVGLVLLLYQNKIMGLIRRFGKYLWATKYGRLIVVLIIIAILVAMIMLLTTC